MKDIKTFQSLTLVIENNSKMIFNKLPTILQLRRLFQMYSYTLFRTHGEATNLRNKNASLSLRMSMRAHIFRKNSKGRRSILKVSSEQ